MWIITQSESQKLVVIKADSALTFNSLLNVLDTIYLENEGRFSSFNRFANLSDIEKIEVDLKTLVRTVRYYRKAKPPENDIKIAIYLPYGTTYVLAENYIIMTEDDTYNSMVSDSYSKCAEFLGVEKNLLTA